MPLELRTKSDINSSISRLESLLNSNILSTQEQHLFKESVFIEVLILLRDLLRKSEKYFDKRIDFTDDVNITDNILDVNDLIKNYRDAACHIESKDRNFDKNLVLNFNIIYGKCVAIQYGDNEIGSKYKDDVAFITGSNILYLKRHIFRTFSELITVFSSHNILHKTF